MNNKVHTEVTDLEVKARAVLAKLDWTPQNALIAFVFKAMYSSALSVEAINAIGKATFGSWLPDNKALTAAVRQGVLRSRMIRGVRHYEINF